ncbi:ester cyclase [Deinococcus sp. UYEF24]
MTPTLRTLTVLAALGLPGLSLALPYPTGATLPAASGRPVPSIVQKWADAWNHADPAGMVQLFTDDGVYQDFAFQAKNTGKDGVAGWVALTLKSIPNSHAALLDAFQIGDRAAVQWVFSGTPVGFGDLGGRSFSVPVTSVFELKGGKIEQVTDSYNRADLFHQLGLPSDSWVAPKP